MKTKTTRCTINANKPAATVLNLNRPWRTTDIVAGNLILNWHGEEIARVQSDKMSPEAAKAVRAMIVKAVNTHEAAMRVVNLMALMKHTCAKRNEKGHVIPVHSCGRCLAEIAQARAEVK